MTKVDAVMTMTMLVEGIVCALVDDQAAVEVTGDLRQGCFVANIRVAPGDVGKVIGKQGRTARSLRTIVSAAAMKAKLGSEINIVEDGRRERTGAA